jgi:hypothetical protein
VIKEDVVVLLGFLPSEVPTLEEMMIQSPFSLSDVVVDCVVSNHLTNSCTNLFISHKLCILNGVGQQRQELYAYN